MPNLGQGGCQAIEDGFVLTDLLCSIDNKSQLKGVLQEYYRKRIVRSAIVQGMSRLSSDIIITSFSTPFKFSGMNHSPTHMRCTAPLLSLTNNPSYLHCRIREGGFKVQVPHPPFYPDLVFEGIPAIHLLRPVRIPVLLRTLLFQQGKDHEVREGLSFQKQSGGPECL